MGSLIYRPSSHLLRPECKPSKKTLTVSILSMLYVVSFYFEGDVGVTANTAMNTVRGDYSVVFLDSKPKPNPPSPEP